MTKAEFEFVSARVSDARRLAEAHVAAWREAYQGIVPDAYLAQLDIGQREQGWVQILKNAQEGETTILKIEGDEVTGFVDVGPQRNEDLEVDGEINAIYVRKAFYGKRPWPSSHEERRGGFARRGPHVRWALGP